MAENTVEMKDIAVAEDTKPLQTSAQTSSTLSLPAAEASAALKAPATPKEYVLRWGGATWFVELLVTGILGSLVTGLFYHLGPSREFFDTEFDPMMGYFIWASIAQGTFFKNRRPGPNAWGFLRYPLTLVLGVATFYLHEFIIKEAYGVKDAALAGHFVWIVFGFFLYGVDDTYFHNSLAGWIKYNPIKAVFWYIMTWLGWLLLFQSPLICNAGEEFRPVTWIWFLATLQYLVIIKIIIGNFAKEWLDECFSREVKVTASPTTLNAGDVESQTVTKTEVCKVTRGLVSLFVSIIAAVALAFTVYSWVHVVFSERATVAEMWKHVLNTGAIPLLVVIPVGIYSEALKSWVKPKGQTCCDCCSCKTGKCNHGRWAKGQMTWGQVTFIRFMITIAGSFASYYFYHLVIAPSGLLGDHPWYAHYDLAWNFCVATFGLCINWFTGKLGFVKEKKD